MPRLCLPLLFLLLLSLAGSAQAQELAPSPPTCQLDEQGYLNCRLPAAQEPLMKDGIPDICQVISRDEQVLVLRCKTEDLVAPKVEIIDGPPAASADTSTLFSFRASEDSVTSCRLDEGDWQPCRNEMQYQDLSSGKHRFLVQALGLSGGTAQAEWNWLVDPTGEAGAASLLSPRPILPVRLTSSHSLRLSARVLRYRSPRLKVIISDLAGLPQGTRPAVYRYLKGRLGWVRISGARVRYRHRWLSGRAAAKALARAKRVHLTEVQVLTTKRWPTRAGVPVPRFVVRGILRITA